MSKVCSLKEAVASYVKDGDTLYAALEVDEVTPQRTTGVIGLRSTVHNQKGELVMDGRQRYLLRRRPA